MKKHELINNRQDACFEFHIDGQVAKIDYALAGGAVALTHTEIPHSLRGQGIGTELVGSVLSYIEGEGLKVIPLCGFVAGYIRENPQWKRIVAA